MPTPDAFLSDAHLPDHRAGARPAHRVDALPEDRADRADALPTDPTDPVAPAEPGPGARRLPEYADRVLDVVETIPAGRVLAYGDIAALLGEGGPRQVGQVMARYGGAVCWWRVVRSDGRAPQGNERRALEHYHAEGTPLRDATEPRLDMRRARWHGDT